MDATDFPADLMQTQAAWNASCQALAAPRPRDTTVLRRRLLRLSLRLWWHPYWQTVPWVPAAHAELCGSVRACEAQRSRRSIVGSRARSLRP